MSELKAYIAYEADDFPDETEFYLKSEADKVIAGKDAEIAELKEQVSEERSAKVDYKISAHDLSDGLKKAYEEIRHNEYKRCLAMASKCRLRARWFGDNAFYKKEQWALQWHRRWLELAEKFKEAK